VKELKPVRKPTTKDQVERMYKVAYYLDRSFFKPADILDFGLDIYRLKEFGEVKMKRAWSKIRPQAEALWVRMTDSMKVMFYWSYYCEGLDYLRLILAEMEPLVKNVGPERSGVEALSSSMSHKLPPALQTKISEGFGREWGRE
jgi:hypothetical protein